MGDFLRVIVLNFFLLKKEKLRMFSYLAIWIFIGGHIFLD